MQALCLCAHTCARTQKHTYVRPPGDKAQAVQHKWSAARCAHWQGPGPSESSACAENIEERGSEGRGSRSGGCITAALATELSGYDPDASTQPLGTMSVLPPMRTGGWAALSCLSYGGKSAGGTGTPIDHVSSYIYHGQELEQLGG